MARRVLIVDDHAEFRAVARAMLERGGFEVIGEAVDGAATLRAVAQTRPDVVLLDVQLPDIDGFEVASRVTRTEAAPVVILISSRDGRDFGGLVTSSGARGFVPKNELSGDVLRAYLDG